MTIETMMTNPNEKYCWHCLHGKRTNRCFRNATPSPTDLVYGIPDNLYYGVLNAYRERYPNIFYRIWCYLRGRDICGPDAKFYERNYK